MTCSTAWNLIAHRQSSLGCVYSQSTKTVAYTATSSPYKVGRLPPLFIMPRRKKHSQYQHFKHQHVDAGDGWTHVVAGPSIKLANSNPKAETAVELMKQLRGSRYDSLEAMHAAHQTQKEALKKHFAYVAFLKQLDKELTDHPNVEVSHGLCLGLGSISNPYGSEHNHNSLKQLILMEGVMEQLKARSRLAERAPVYFQDPAFTPMDAQFLTSLGYRVIPFPFGGDPWSLHKVRHDVMAFKSRDGLVEMLPMASLQVESSAYITEKTFLYTPHLEFNTVALALIEAVPSLFLGPDLNDVEDKERIPYELRQSLETGICTEQEVESYRTSLSTAMQALDWKETVEIIGNDFYWYNRISFGFAKVPRDWVVSSNERDQRLAESITARHAAIALDEQNHQKWLAKGPPRPPGHKDINWDIPLSSFIDFPDSKTLNQVYYLAKNRTFNSKPYVGLCTQLDAATLRDPNLRFTEIVCLGLGSLAKRAEVTHIQSFEQLALLEQAVQFLRKTGVMAASAPVYLQDPLFTDIDVQFLQGLGYQVIPWPPVISEKWTKEQGEHFFGRSFTNDEWSMSTQRVQCKPYLTKNTFLYCPNSSAPITESAIDYLPPAAYLGPGSPFWAREDRKESNFRFGQATDAFCRNAAWAALDSEAYPQRNDLDAALKPANHNSTNNSCGYFALAIRDGAVASSQ